MDVTANSVRPVNLHGGAYGPVNFAARQSAQEDIENSFIYEFELCLWGSMNCVG